MIDQQPRSHERATRAGWYLFGVIRADGLARLRRDLSSVPLAHVRHGDLGALGSDAPLRDPREGLMRHADVVQRVFERTTILPARYGVVLPAPRVLVETLLEPHHGRLLAGLRRLRGMAQVMVTGIHREEPALARLLKDDRVLARRRHEANRSYDAAVRLGQRIAGDLARLRAEDAATVLDALRPYAMDERASPVSHEHMFLRTAFMVRAAELGAFDDAVGEVQRRVPHGTIRAVGPQAPYAFVDLDAGGEAAWA
jgi:hypothetical protein